MKIQTIKDKKIALDARIVDNRVGYLECPVCHGLLCNAYRTNKGKGRPSVCKACGKEQMAKYGGVCCQMARQFDPTRRVNKECKCANHGRSKLILLVQVYKERINEIEYEAYTHIKYLQTQLDWHADSLSQLQKERDNYENHLRKYNYKDYFRSGVGKRH